MTMSRVFDITDSLAVFVFRVLAIIRIKPDFLQF